MVLLNVGALYSAEEKGKLASFLLSPQALTDE